MLTILVNALIFWAISNSIFQYAHKKRFIYSVILPKRKDEINKNLYSKEHNHNLTIFYLMILLGGIVGFVAVGMCVARYVSSYSLDAAAYPIGFLVGVFSGFIKDKEKKWIKESEAFISKKLNDSVTDSVNGVAISTSRNDNINAASNLSIKKDDTNRVQEFSKQNAKHSLYDLFHQNSPTSSSMMNQTIPNQDALTSQNKSRVEEAKSEPETKADPKASESIDAAAIWREAIANIPNMFVKAFAREAVAITFEQNTLIVGFTSTQEPKFKYLCAPVNFEPTQRALQCIKPDAKLVFMTVNPAQSSDQAKVLTTTLFNDMKSFELNVKFLETHERFAKASEEYIGLATLNCTEKIR